MGVKRRAIIAKYLCAEAKHKYGFNEAQIKKLDEHLKCQCPKVPQQNDGASCGMFLLEYIERIIVDRSYMDKIAVGHDCEDEKDSDSYKEKQWFLEERCIGRRK